MRNHALSPSPIIAAISSSLGSPFPYIAPSPAPEPACDPSIPAAMNCSHETFSMFMSECTAISIAYVSWMFVLNGDAAAGAIGGVWCGKTGLFIAEVDGPGCAMGHSGGRSALVLDRAVLPLT